MRHALPFGNPVRWSSLDGMNARSSLMALASGSMQVWQGKNDLFVLLVSASILLLA